MRVLASYTDRFHLGVFAVVANRLVVDPGEPPTLIYRLIRSSDPNWQQTYNTTRSISRTPGIQIYSVYTVAVEYLDLQSTQVHIKDLIIQAQLLSGYLNELRTFQRSKP